MERKKENMNKYNAAVINLDQLEFKLAVKAMEEKVTKNVEWQSKNAMEATTHALKEGAVFTTAVASSLGEIATNCNSITGTLKSAYNGITSTFFSNPSVKLDQVKRAIVQHNIKDKITSIVQTDKQGNYVVNPDHEAKLVRAQRAIDITNTEIEKNSKEIKKQTDEFNRSKEVAKKRQGLFKTNIR
jgi:hypothetical protein